MWQSKQADALAALQRRAGEKGWKLLDKKPKARPRQKGQAANHTTSSAYGRLGFSCVALACHFRMGSQVSGTAHLNGMNHTRWINAQKLGNAQRCVTADGPDFSRLPAGDARARNAQIFSQPNRLNALGLEQSLEVLWL